MENQLSNSSDYLLDDFNSTRNKKIYKINHIRNATFFGGPLVGAYMINENFKVMGDNKRISQTWIISIAVFIGMAFISYLLSTVKSSPRLLLPLLISALTGYYAKNNQEEFINQHLASNGNTYDAWRVVGIAVVGFAIQFALIFIGVILISEE
jgi:hypothetical protein